MTERIDLQAIVTDEMGGSRFDQVAVKLFPDYSRSRLQGWIKSGALTIDNEKKRAKEKVWGGAVLKIAAELEIEGEWEAEDIPLDIVYEDDSIVVINKPADLVVHPAAGNRTGTLLNGLLFKYPFINTVPRAGIVHRLDKDTTGLMVVAKDLSAHHHLVNQLQERTVSREYEAVVLGEMTGGGTIELPIGRHPRQRLQMAVVEEELGGKEAITHYRLVKRFQNHVHVRVKLETGRTHQIRVHMAHLKHPLVGDRLYLGGFKIPKNSSHELVDYLRHFPRQALHAKRLGLIHPATEEYMEWECDLPADLVELLDRLTHDRVE